MIYTELPYQESEQVFLALQDKNMVFLDSSLINEKVGRHSTIAFDPCYQIKAIAGKCYLNSVEDSQHTDVIAFLKHHTHATQLQHLDNLPPFQGGLAGYFSYDFARYLEKLPEHAVNDTPYPEFELGCFDVVISFDHVLQKTWLISSGLPETTHAARMRRAEQRLRWAQRYISENMAIQTSQATTSHQGTPRLHSNFSHQSYLNAILQAKNFIVEGDIFEVNISQRFTVEDFNSIDPAILYQTLRKVSPAPFSAFVRLGEHVIASSSPERFLQVHNRVVESRPIKGTRPRGSNPTEDAKLANELCHSKKDKAENTMIVDLMRNDLSKICKINSISVPQYCGLETYQYVHHLVSVVTGVLEDNKDCIDIIKATFPGGSITGAPKLRAMEIIEELEPTRRGPYCGSIGYISGADTMDLSIAIRTILFHQDTISFQVGGAIVLDSDPEAEYQETLIKASGIKKTLDEVCDASDHR